MNIEPLNAWAGVVAPVAIAILWQSSVLIAVVWVFDSLLGRKLRPANRYAIWLMVLIKLVLPPGLAFPTGLAWWMRPPVQPVHWHAMPAVSHAVADVGLTPSVAVPAQLPKPTLALPAALLLVSAGVSSLLAAYLVCRWRRVAQRTAGAQAALDSSLLQLLEEARQAAGVRRPVTLRIVQEVMSPALFGLLKPVLLLPEPLTRRLSRAELRAVLLHELIHLRRGDIWINCFQAALQIVYWWHPLVWFANSRIRHVREEAVDEAVMLVLEDEREHYAPTLLAVARLGLGRPLASLGLVGILESHRALRQRIERLVAFRAPKRARAGLVSLASALAFGALALPMGQAPASATAPADSNLPGSTPSRDAASSQTDTKVLIQNGKLLYEMGKVAEAEKEFRQALKQNPQEQAAYYYLSLIAEGRRKQTGVKSTNEPVPLYTRQMSVDPNLFEIAMRSFARDASSASGKPSLAQFKSFLESVGVNLQPPKTIFLDGHGNLFLRATLQDLDVIEAAVQALNMVPPQLHIRVGFIELNESDAAAFWAEHALDARSGAGVRAIQLNARQAKAQSDYWDNIGKLVARYSVTTLSGRAAAISSQEPQPVAVYTNSPFAQWVTNEVPVGPRVEVVPTISADTMRVDLALTASMTDYLGATGQSGNTVSEPRFRMRQWPVTASVWDGETLVIGGVPNQTMQPPGQLEPSKKEMLILVTPTTIDAAGNRTHTTQQVERAQRGSLWEGDFPASGRR